MTRPVLWRVRVVRGVESWVSVMSTDAASAEVEAKSVPGVISVFGKSAIRGDESMVQERPEGVREE